MSRRTPESIPQIEETRGMKILTSSQMKEVDRLTIETIGIPGTTLMENAGIQVVQVMEEHFEHLETLQVAVVCGPGNNGGDGFVIARQLYMRGVVPCVYVVCPRERIQGDALVNLRILENYGEIPILDVPDMAALDLHGLSFDSFQIVVDAILGTGIERPVEGFLAKVIETVNRSSASVVAVDIPSGLFADEYIPVESAVFSDLTVTFTSPKPGLLMGEAYAYVGDLYTVAIGVPDALLLKPGHDLNLVESETVEGFFLPRKRDTHKGTYGHVLVVGGYAGKAGAARLAGQAVLRSGAGLCTLAVPAGMESLVSLDCAELMAESIPLNQGGIPGAECVERVLELLETRDLLLLGPGIGTAPETVRFLQELMPRLEVPAILDADALNCLSQDISLLGRVNVPLVLTPHPGEMARLLGCTTGEVQEDREGRARDFACRFGVYLVLKGHRSLVADPTGQVWVNLTGNPGMATAGAGDVLSGVLAAYCARINHRNPHAWTLACTAAVHVHGLAGDLAAESFTEESLLARDIIHHLHVAVKKIKGE